MMTPLFAHPVLTCAEAKGWETDLLKDEAAEWAAMQQAGAAIARAVLEDFKEIGGLPAAARLLVLVGKGHNGGDALLAAKAILEQYPQVTADIVLAFGEGVLRPLAKRSLDLLVNENNRGTPVLGTPQVLSDVGPSLATRLPGSSIRHVASDGPTGENKQLSVTVMSSPGEDPAAPSSGHVRIVSLPEKAGSMASAYALCLDGIFGFQFRPPMDAATAGLIAQVNAHPSIQLRAAVDLPSGLGETNAETIFRADFTCATGIVKTSVVATANAAYVGRLRYLDLGFFKVGRVVPNAPPPTDRVLLPSILAPLAQLRPAQTDKRTYGHLLVVGGSRDYPGAVLMAVQAALRSGVGLLTACVPASLVPEYASRFPEAMWVGFPENSHGGLTESGLPLLLEKLPRATAVLIGPGLGSSVETLEAIRNFGRIATKMPGRNPGIPLVLDADALRPEILTEVAGRPLIATPHAGELARIGGREALRPGQVLVSKGSLTCVSDGRTNFFSPYGGPVLARGGSGDLLAGLIGGLLAQAPDDLLLAATRGTVWHGLAADLLARDQGQVAVQTTQLLDYLAPALRTTP